MARRPLDLLAGIEHEIRGEKSSSLGRMGDKLDAALGELPALAQAAVNSATPGERAAHVAAFNAARAQAEEAFYWLCVQREAMGVRNHDMLAAMYPIPPKLR
jgi:hypothetical protein